MKKPYFTFLTSHDGECYDEHQFYKYKTEKELLDKWKELDEIYSGYTDVNGKSTHVLKHWKLIKVLDTEIEVRA